VCAQLPLIVAPSGKAPCGVSTHFFGDFFMAVGRPSSPNSKYFQRILKPAEKKILVHAGRGDMSAGFHHLLEVYSFLWIQGFRPHKSLDCLRVGNGTDQASESDTEGFDAPEGYS
jgi:hypothetical protein